jgi:hypothetical protein
VHHEPLLRRDVPDLGESGEVRELSDRNPGPHRAEGGEGQDHAAADPGDGVQQAVRHARPDVDDHHAVAVHAGPARDPAKRRQTLHHGLPEALAAGVEEAGRELPLGRSPPGLVRVD